MDKTKNQSEAVTELGSILGIWAHPDDETWSSAGLMRIAGQNGQRIGVITATKGEGGQTADESRWPQKDLGTIRMNELATALRDTAAIEHTWLNYPDGDMENADHDNAIKEIGELISNFQPDTIITFEPNGITGHPDHKTIHTWTVEAVKRSGLSPRILCSARVMESSDAVNALDRLFNIKMEANAFRRKLPEKADFLIRLDPSQLDAKIKALRKHESQVEQMFGLDGGENVVRELVKLESFIEHHLH